MARSNELPRRQKVRRGILYTSLMVFPVTMYYLSPVLSLAGASQNLVTGSVIVFGLQFLFSLILGRAFCGWVCPGGAVQEVFYPIQTRRLRPRWTRSIKWIIWTLWFGFLVYLFLTADGGRSVDFDAFTKGGISVVDAQGYIVYYLVLTAFVVLSLTLGRRGGCHTICWMAPFMIIGTWIRNHLRIPALHLGSEPERCIHCSRCTDACPMSIEVEHLAQQTTMDSLDCILCGECVDACPETVIGYRFSCRQSSYKN